MKKTGNTILFLPDAGPDNPFQYMLVDYLKENGYKVVLGKKKSLFTVIQCVFKCKPEIIYFDWVHSFLIGETKLFSWVKSLTFCVEILIVKFLFGVKIVHTIHNIHNHAGRSIRLERFFYSWFLKRCDNVRVYTEDTIAKIEQYTGVTIKNFIVSPDLPYTLHYKRRSTIEEGYEHLGLKEKKFVYLFIGNVKPYKGVEELLGVFSLKEFKDDVLVIAGRVQKGEYAEQLQNKLSQLSNVQLIDRFISEEELPDYFAVANVCVFPFRNIEHSGSVELAMSFGKAVITCKVPSILEILNQQQELLYSNQTELADKMLFSKSVDLGKIGQENYQVIDRTQYQTILKLFSE